MKINEKCHELHQLFNSLKSHRFTKAEIDTLGFNNGVYIIFEEGEKAHDSKRIVRIGTHNKPDKLQQRLNQHRSKRRGIFRRMIGSAILSKDNPKDPDIKRWYAKDLKSIKSEKLTTLQESVTQHIENKTTFVAFEVKGTGKKERGTLFWEEKIIATIASCEKCVPSKNWLGNYLPENIGEFSLGKKHGLWLSGGIGKPILEDSEFEELVKIINQTKKKYG